MANVKGKAPVRAHQPRPADRITPRFLTVPQSSLYCFGAGSNSLALPFVTPDSNWSIKPSATSREREEQGCLYAAAFLIFIQQNGIHELGLPGVVADMKDPDGEVETAFLWHLTHYVWASAQGYSANEIYADALARIQEHRELDAVDEERLDQLKVVQKGGA